MIEKNSNLNGFQTNKIGFDVRKFIDIMINHPYFTLCKHAS